MYVGLFDRLGTDHWSEITRIDNINHLIVMQYLDDGGIMTDSNYRRPSTAEHQ